MKTTPKYEGDPIQDRILIPNNEKIRREVLHWCHEHPTAGHFGVTATCLRATPKFFWPGMATYLTEAVKKCDRCLAKQKKVNHKQTIHQPRRHGYIGQVLYIDLVGPLPRTDTGNAYIVTMQDGYSRWVSAIPIPNKEAATVANAALEGWITKYGCPSQIHSDQGTEFKNTLWSELMD